jgi:N-acylneuraminate cytidylyltransferase
MVLSPGGQVVAVIPARGGSKGIPRKNLARVAGRPLIAWSIEAGVAAESVDRVVVSTDDEEIAEVARTCGAEVPFLRPSELARDDTPDLPVFQHLLAELDAPGAAGPDTAIELLVHLRPTSPLRPEGLVDEGIRLLRADADADSVRSLSAPPKTPYKMWRVEHGVLEPLLGGWDRELFNRPRQQLPEVWVHDGVLDVVRAPVVRAGSMCGRRVLPLFTPPGTAVDIDTPDDLDRAAGMLDPSER